MSDIVGAPAPVHVYGPRFQASKHLGAMSELRACLWLTEQGYEVFRNVSGHGIADIVAWRIGAAPVPIDVKTLTYCLNKRGEGYYLTTGKPSPEQAKAGVRILWVCRKTGHAGFDPVEVARQAGVQALNPRLSIGPRPAPDQGQG